MNKINTLSKSELIVLQATLHVMDNKEYHCDSCLSRYEGRENENILLEKWRRLKGCFGNDAAVKPRIGELIYSTCPGNVFNRSAHYVIDLYRDYQKGVLPFEGSLTDQPAKIMECFDVVDAFNNDKILAQQKKDQMKAQRNGTGFRRNTKSGR